MQKYELLVTPDAGCSLGRHCRVPSARTVATNASPVHVPTVAFGPSVSPSDRPTRCRAAARGQGVRSHSPMANRLRHASGNSEHQALREAGNIRPGGSSPGWPGWR
jgi:hypothetical protein